MRSRLWAPARQQQRSAERWLLSAPATHARGASGTSGAIRPGTLGTLTPAGTHTSLPYIGSARGARRRGTKITLCTRRFSASAGSATPTSARAHAQERIHEHQLDPVDLIHPTTLRLSDLAVEILASMMRLARVRLAVRGRPHLSQHPQLHQLMLMRRRPGAPSPASTLHLQLQRSRGTSEVRSEGPASEQHQAQTQRHAKRRLGLQTRRRGPQPRPTGHGLTFRPPSELCAPTRTTPRCESCASYTSDGGTLPRRRWPAYFARPASVKTFST